MIDKLVTIVTTAFAVTAVGIAFRRGSAAPAVINATTGGIAKMQTAAFGPK